MLIELERTRDLSPSEWIQLAEQEAAREALTDARAAYEAALAAMASSTAPGLRLRALGGLSWALCRLGDGQGALRRGLEALDLQQATDPAADAPGAIINGLIGNALMAQEQHAAALDRYAVVLTMQQKLGEAPAAQAATLELLGEAALRLGRFDVSEDYLSRAAQLLRECLPAGDRRLGQALSNYGGALLCTEKLAEAETVLREALSIDEGLELAADNLVFVLFKLDREEEGTELARARYRRKSFFTIKSHGKPRGTLLVLWSTSGMVPHRHLLAGLPMTRVNWFAQYSTPAQESQMPRYDVALNLVGDADHTDSALAAVMAYEPRCPVRLLNKPSRIDRTRRHEIAELLAGVPGLVVPKVMKTASDALRHGAAPDVLRAGGLTLPVLLRDAGHHGGESVRRVDTEAELEAACNALEPGCEMYVTAYHDYASADGAYRKYRAIFIDRVPYPYHLAISPRWLVHYFSAEMLDRPQRQAEELRYLADMPGAIGELAMSALTEVGRRMDLDYCGIDFGLLPDGQMVFFESNATMLVHPEPQDGPFRAKNPYVAKILSAFQDMVQAAMPPALPEPGNPSSQPPRPNA